MQQRAVCLAAMVCAFQWCAAQTVPPEAVPSSSRVAQLPLSGRTGPPPAAFQGSASPSPAPGPPIELSLDDAVRRGLQYNLGATGYRQAARVAEAQRAMERAALLPNVASNLLVTDQQTNLAALGFTGESGFPIRPIVGPFHYFDVRAGVSQTVFDFTRLRNYRASQESARAVELGGRDARDAVVLAVTGGYLQVLAAAARVDAVRAQVATAKAAYQQALDRFTAGIVPRIDVTRSLVELQIEQQRQTARENELARFKLDLARTIGLPPGQEFSLSDILPFAPLTSIALDQALSRAFANRADLKAAESQVRAAELAKQAAQAERLPSAQVSGNYGVIGPSPQNSHGTFGVTGSIRLPIFQGGRVQADIEQADAVLQQRRAELADVRGRIDAEIRAAMLDIQSAAAQITVAESNRGLAQETLTHARDRFTAGVADTVELVQAQQTVAVAEQDYIASLFAHNVAKAALARAMGQADQNIREFLSSPK